MCINSIDGFASKWKHCYSPHDMCWTSGAHTSAEGYKRKVHGKTISTMRNHQHKERARTHTHGHVENRCKSYKNQATTKKLLQRARESDASAHNERCAERARTIAVQRAQSARTSFVMIIRQFGFFRCCCCAEWHEYYAEIIISAFTILQKIEFRHQSIYELARSETEWPGLFGHAAHTVALRRAVQQKSRTIIALQ